MPPKEPASPTKPAAATGGRGSMGGGISASAVDTDKLWRDRIQQELQFQRQWKEEYGFLMGTNSNKNNSTDRSLVETTSKNNASSSSKDITANLLESTKPVGSASATININDISPQDLAALQKKLQNAQYTSTTQASYKYDRSKLLELGSGTNRKQKFRV